MPTSTHKEEALKYLRGQEEFFAVVDRDAFEEGIRRYLSAQGETQQEKHERIQRALMTPPSRCKP